MTNLKKPQTKLELLALFGKARDEELDAAQTELLNELLVSDSSIRGLYRGFIAIESGLEEIAKIQLGKDAPTNTDMLIIDDTIAEISIEESHDPAVRKNEK